MVEYKKIKDRIWTNRNAKPKLSLTLLHEAEVYGAREARERDASPSVEILTDVEDRLTLPEVAEGKAKTKKDKKKKWISTLILVAFNVIAIAVVLWLELKDDAQAFVGIDDLGKQIGGNYYWLLIALGAYAAHTLSDAFVYFTIYGKSESRYAYGLHVAVRQTHDKNIHAGRIRDNFIRDI